jgi:hypothetical protein
MITDAMVAVSETPLIGPPLVAAPAGTPGALMVHGSTNLKGAAP